MDLYSLAEGPLLWFAFLLLVVGMVLRIAFFFIALIKSSRALSISNRSKKFTLAYIAASFALAWVPFHKAVLQKPVFTALRYVFHFSLIIVPVWLSGHIVLWEESRFEWSWTALPDAWADRMTLLVIGIAAYFLIRRVAISELRRNSSISDYVLILLAAAPFITGYLFTQGSLDAVPFFEYHMETIHILSAEAMLIGVVFLFYRTRLNVQTCTGCAACEITCPTNTLQSSDEGGFRIFSYHHYQCICCGACVKVCPENAASLRHELRPVRFFQIFSRQEIRSVALAECKSCGSLFGPEPQLERIKEVISADFTNICPNCRVYDFMRIVKPAGPKALSRMVW